MRTPLVWLALGLFACGPSSRDDGTGAHIVVDPPDLVVQVIDGNTIVQPYTATEIDVDGDDHDVTATAVFTVAEPAFGVWTGSTITISGGAAGPTRVIAQTPTAQGDTGLTVKLTGHRDDGPNVPPNAPDLFGTATETAGRAPSIAYPDDNIVVPPNLGEFDVHWHDTAANSLFEVSLHNQYVDLKIYKAGSGDQFTIYSPNEWFSVAASRDPLTITVAGLQVANPTVKGTSPIQTVSPTNEIVQGRS